MGDDRQFYKFVNDVGVAAYLLMHGHTVVGKKGRAIYFRCHNADEASEFDGLVLEYQPPNSLYTFDSCLMYLKKVGDTGVIPESATVKRVTDLGVAAYIMMHEYDATPLKTRVLGKDGSNVFFAVPQDKAEAFRRLSYGYFTSQYHDYDSKLRGLKRVPDFIAGHDN